MANMSKDQLPYVSLFETPWEDFLSETGTDTCVLNWQLRVHDNITPPATQINVSHTFDFMSFKVVFFLLVLCA